MALRAFWHSTVVHQFRSYVGLGLGLAYRRPLMRMGYHSYRHCTQLYSSRIIRPTHTPIYAYYTLFMLICTCSVKAITRVRFGIGGSTFEYGSKVFRKTFRCFKVTDLHS